MGDYATRLADGESIKVGSCGAMYYCRYEQINEILMDGVYNLKDRLKDCLWRIPAIEEDGTKVGEYEYGGLYKAHDFGTGVKHRYLLYSVLLQDFPKDSDWMSLADDKGIVQKEVESLGMILNVPCYHGLKLPEGGDVRAFFNGKRNPLHPCFLKNTETELLVGIRCIACGHMWSVPFNEIEPYIVSLDMKLRLFNQCAEYWHEHNTEHCPYEVKFVDKNDEEIKMVSLASGVYDVVKGHLGVSTVASFDENVELFKNLITRRKENKLYVRLCSKS